MAWLVFWTSGLDGGAHGPIPPQIATIVAVLRLPLVVHRVVAWAAVDGAQDTKRVERQLVIRVGIGSSQLTERCPSPHREH